MKGGDHRVELLGHRAHRGGADRPPEDRQQRPADFAHRQPEDKAREDHAVDLRGATGIGAHDIDRREAAGARHRQFNVAELGQQMPSITAVAPVGLVEQGHPLEMVVDRLRHLALQDGGDRLPAQPPVTLTPLQPVRLHRLHEFKCSR